MPKINITPAALVTTSIIPDPLERAISHANAVGFATYQNLYSEGCSEAEKEIIHTYTRNQTLFNNFLKQGVDIDAPSNINAKKLSIALDKLPNSTEVTFRGLGSPKGTYGKKIVAGDIVKNDLFMSTSLSNSYAKQCAYSSNEEQVFFEVYGRTGKNISALSRFQGVKGEAEVLFQPNTFFEVKRVEKINNMRYVVVKEIIFKPENQAKLKSIFSGEDLSLHLLKKGGIYDVSLLQPPVLPKEVMPLPTDNNSAIISSALQLPTLPSVDTAAASAASGPARKQNKALTDTLMNTLSKLSEAPETTDGLSLVDALQSLREAGRDGILREIITSRPLLNQLAVLANSCCDNTGMGRQPLGEPATAPLRYTAELTRQMLRDGQLQAAEISDLWFTDGEYAGPATRILPLRGIQSARHLCESVFAHLPADILHCSSATPETQRAFTDTFRAHAKHLLTDALIGNREVRKELVRNIEQAGIKIKHKNSVTCTGGKIEVSIKPSLSATPSPDAFLTTPDTEAFREHSRKLQDHYDRATASRPGPSSSAPVREWQNMQQEKRLRHAARSEELGRLGGQANETNSMLAAQRQAYKAQYARDVRRMQAEQLYAQDQQRKAIARSEDEQRAAAEREKWTAQRAFPGHQEASRPVFSRPLPRSQPVSEELDIYLDKAPPPPPPGKSGGFNVGRRAGT